MSARNVGALIGAVIDDAHSPPPEPVSRMAALTAEMAGLALRRAALRMFSGLIVQICLNFRDVPGEHNR